MGCSKQSGLLRHQAKSNNIGAAARSLLIGLAEDSSFVLEAYGKWDDEAAQDLKEGFSVL